MLVKLTEVSVVVYMISQSIQAPGLVLNYDLLEDSCHVTINNILLFYHVRQTDSMLPYRTVIGHRRCNVVKTLNLLTYMTALRCSYHILMLSTCMIYHWTNTPKHDVS